MSRTARLHLGFARLLRSVGWSSGAAAACRDAIAAEPRWAQAHLELGEALADRGNWPDACAEFEQTVRLQPDNDDARGNLVITLSKLGRIHDAVVALEGLAHKRPHDAEIHLLLGTLYRRAHRHDDAVRAFRWAVRLPAPPDTRRCTLGEALLGEESWAGVLASYSHAAAVSARTPVPPPQWHSPLNQHPARTVREFRNAPRVVKRTAPTPGRIRTLLRTPFRAVGVALASPFRLGRLLVVRSSAPPRRRRASS
jgi:tetratricopeptide (TPR) repeat protein